MDLGEIEEMIRSRLYDEALVACEAWLGENPDGMPEVARLRSWLFTRQGDYAQGVAELLQIINSEKATINDFHSAGLWSLYDAQFSNAKQWFEKVLELGEIASDTWFECSTLLYLSYTSMVLGCYRQAQAYLEDPRLQGQDIEVLIPTIGSCTREDLRREINRRTAGSA